MRLLVKILRWCGHARRRDENRLIKIYESESRGRIRVGRSGSRWMDNERECMRERT